MALKSNHGKQIEQFHAEFLKRLFQITTEALNRTAMQTVEIAIKKASGMKYYTDRTTNLRSSIGYVLYHNGVKVSSSFSAHTGTTEGKKEGESFADEVASKMTQHGFNIVIVAGMHYAAYVEAKGYDVITGATMEFEGFLKQNLDVVQEISNVDFKSI